MRIRPVCAALLLLALAPATARTQPQAAANRNAAAPALDAGYLSEADAIRQEALEKYVVLARWCKEERLLVQARYLCNEILAEQPDNEIRSLSEELKAMPPRTFQSKNRTTKKMLKRYADQKQVIDVPTAKKYVKLAKAQAKLKHDAEEIDAYKRAYRYNKANRSVNHKLKRAGYDAVYNYGLISADEKKRFAKSLRDVEGTFLDLRNKQYKRQVKYWPDAWGFQTRHYLLMSNASHKIVFPFAVECEALWQGIRVYGGDELHFRDNYKSEKLVVWLFGDEQSYEVVLQGQGIQKNPSPGAAGFFGAYQRSYFFWADRFYGRGGQSFKEGLRALAGTFYHEGTHQMMALQLDVKSAGSGRKYRAFWAVEAVANYMATMEWKEDDQGKKHFTFGFPDPYEGYRAANSHMKGAVYIANGHGKWRFTPLRIFTTNDQGAYMSAGANHYSQAMALVHYLNHAEGGKYKKVWFEYLRQQYTQNGSSAYLWEMMSGNGGGGKAGARGAGKGKPKAGGDADDADTITEAALTKAYIDWIKTWKVERPKVPPGGRPGGPGKRPPPGGWPGGKPPK